MNQQLDTKAPQDTGVPAWARDFGVRDRVVLITGAGQGIGREVARQFGAAGAIPVVVDLDIENVETVKREIETAGGRAMALKADVTKPDEVQAMVDAIIAEHGRIDVLLNNAAIFSSLAKRPFDEIPLDEWDFVMRVNVNGPFLCARAVAPHMREAGWGRIINVSTTAVPKGVVNYLHYVTSKSAMTGFTTAMARELGGFGINVNSIRPGAVATEVERTVNTTTEMKQRQIDQQCIKRGSQPPDLVGLILFLSSQASSFITGQTIACDGGMTHGV